MKMMKKRNIIVLIISIILPSSLFATPQDKNTLITVQAEVMEYLPHTNNMIFEDGLEVWSDVVVLRIIYPKEWKDKTLAISCGSEPKDSLWRKIGNIYEFKIEEKYIVGSYPEEGVSYHPGLGAIRGKLKIIKKANNKLTSQSTGSDSVPNGTSSDR